MPRPSFYFSHRATAYLMSKRRPSFFGGWSSVRANWNIKQNIFSPKSKKQETLTLEKEIENPKDMKNTERNLSITIKDKVVSNKKTQIQEEERNTNNLLNEESSESLETKKQTRNSTKSVEVFPVMDTVSKLNNLDKECQIPKRRIISETDKESKRKSGENLCVFFKETIETPQYEKLKKERLRREKNEKNRRKSREVQTKKIKKLLSDNFEEQKEEKELDIFTNQKQLKLFEKYVESRQLSDQFLFYQFYQKYKNENDEYKKEQLSIKLYNEFIDPCGSNAITLLSNELKKIKKFMEKKSPKGFQIVYRHVYFDLHTAMQDFFQLENYEETVQQEEKNEIFKMIPLTFDQLLESKEAYKLFRNFIIDGFGKNYVDCFEEINDFSRELKDPGKMKSKALNIIEQYCKANSPRICIFSPQIRENIIAKDKLTTNWFTVLRQLIYDILSKEYYPRFMNSIIWKDFVHSNFKKESKGFKFHDLYKIDKIKEKEETLSESYEIFTVKNKLTNEIFLGKKIITSENNSRINSVQFLDQVAHENIIQLVELFNEKTSKNMNSLTIITTEVKESLDDYIKELNKKHLPELECVNFMVQILVGLQHLHKEKKYFEFGELTEKNIHLSNLLSTIYIDPGFFHKTPEDIPDFLDSIEDDLMSSASDIYQCGFIFLRLITVLEVNEINEIFNKKFEGKRKRKSLFQKKFVPDYIKNFKVLLESQEMKEKYSNIVLNIVIQMIDQEAKDRPVIEDIIRELKEIQRLLRKQKKRGLTNKFGSLDSNQKILITNTSFRPYVKEFLRFESSVESILFFEDVEVFQNLSTDQERLIKANEIYSNYLVKSSKLEINISGKQKKSLDDELLEARESGNIDLDIFDDIARHVQIPSNL
eukprot:gene3289-5730_t